MTMRRRTFIQTRAFNAAVLLAAATSHAQYIQPEIVASDAQIAPGVDGDPLLFVSPPRFIAIDENGVVAFVAQLGDPINFSGVGVGVFTAGMGRPLTNIADNVADLSAGEFGPVPITGIFTELFDSTIDDLRINSDGSVDFYAETEAAVVLPSGNFSTTATLRGDGTAIPGLVARQDGDLIATGDPIVIWHDVETSPSGSFSVLRYAVAGSPSSMWTAVNGTVGDLFLTEDDPAVVGVPAPAEWLTWTVDAITRPVVGDTGRLAFPAPLRDSQDSLITQRALMAGTPGVGYAPLYDPRTPEVALVGMPAGETVDRLDLLGVTTSDQVIARAEISNFGVSPLALRGDGLWSIDQAGLGTPLILEGSPAPFLDPTQIIQNISARRNADGRVSISCGINDGSNSFRSVAYTIEADGTFGLALQPGDPVIIPGRTDGPFILTAPNTPHLSSSGQLLFTAGFENAAGDLDFGLFYTDPAGTIRPVLLFSDVFDFVPDAPTGEGSSLFFTIYDMNLAGDAVVRIRSGQNQREVLAVFSIAGTPCFADTNGDGDVTPADFNAWVIAFNDQSAACDQNSDGLCTPADFNAWIVNFNAGCP